MSEFWLAATSYLKAGLHPIPCRPRDKRPMIDWLPYQTQQPTRAEIDEWWRRYPSANIALVVGRGIMVVDLDGAGAPALLEEAGIVLPEDAPRVKTGNGQHVYLAPSAELRNRAAVFSAKGGDKAQVDIRADGGYVLAPPSIHPNGSRYEWITSLEFPLPAVPEKLLVVLRERKQPDDQQGALTGPGWVSTALRGAPEGARDDMAARLAGYFITKGLPNDVVLEIMAGFASRCDPPLPMRDIHRIVSSIRRADDRNPEPQREQEKLTTVEHVSVSVARALEIMQAPKGGTQTPFPAVNSLIVGGFQKGELIYLGARPGVGKTAMALEIARHAAKAGQRVLIVSREMLAAALARRMISQEGMLPASKLKLGDIDMSEVSPVAARLSDLPIWITDTARSLTHVGEAMDSVAPEIDLLIVDYLQLIQAPREIRERRLQVEAVSQGLKTFALSRQVPVLCLSSLSRPATGTHPEPTLASLRESGELEHDADIVIFLHRVSQDSSEVLCIVAKNRDGETGKARLMFRPEWVSFAAIETRYADEDRRYA